MTVRDAAVLAFAGAAWLASSAAYAQPVSGPYVSLGAGGNLLQDERTRLNENFPNGKLIFDDPGAVGAVAAGYGFGNGFRVEIEGNWRYNRLRELSGTTFATSSSGQQQNYGGMVNALFDMDVGASWVYPYFGAGAGYSFTNWRSIHTEGDFQSGDYTYDYHADGTHGNFAYQGIFGLSFPVSFVPGLSLTAEYRFFSVTGDASFNATGTSLSADHVIPLYVATGHGYPRYPGTFRGNTDTTSDYNHSALLGLRYALFTPALKLPPAAPTPTPAAMPEVQPQRTYLVFFDWDRADLSERARQIVATAASAATRVQLTRIEVNGYTDLSGTAPYNQRLSVRRAETVEAELVRDGVARGEITVRGYGESNPLVLTAPGVREPQNRRVEIILH
jgi:outer membrane protein OmpA-like peptidoglycan-associated protein